MFSFKFWREIILALLHKMWYIQDVEKRTTAHKGLTSLWMYMKYHPKLSQSQEGGFFMLKYYLTNVKTNVSNTIMNVPKAIKSLKSKWFLFISTTPILCRIEVCHPVTRLFSIDSLTRTILFFNKLLCCIRWTCLYNLDKQVFIKRRAALCPSSLLIHIF